MNRSEQLIHHHELFLSGSICSARNTWSFLLFLLCLALFFSPPFSGWPFPVLAFFGSLFSGIFSVFFFAAALGTFPAALASAVKSLWECGFIGVCSPSIHFWMTFSGRCLLTGFLQLGTSTWKATLGKIMLMEHHGIPYIYMYRVFSNTGFNSQGTGRFRDRVASSISSGCSSGISTGSLLVFGL